MNRKHITQTVKRLVFITTISFSASMGFAQTNVYDDIIATSPNHTTLAAAINAAGLAPALQNENATYTVFAPTDAAFAAIAQQLGVEVTDLLSLPDLTDILLYHVLNTTVPSSAITNGNALYPLNSSNTLKLTLTSDGSAYINQALITTVDIDAENGLVHVIDAVLLPKTTVVDIAINNNFTTLTQAVVQAELLPALTDPFANFTVFAPTNDAFNTLAANLNTDLNGLLALPNLAEVLTYHVLGEEAMSTDLSNGQLATPLNTANTIKLTVKQNGDVFANQAQVTTPDVQSDNGVVHVIDQVILPSETVVDIAINNNFTTLTQAVVQAELLPALTDPFANFTVFAPTNDAFNTLAANLNTDLNGLLALPNLAEVLTYHVLGEEAMSTDLSNGQLATPLNTANTIKLTVKQNGDVFANQAQVTTPDIQSDNGVVHVIDQVILPSETVVDIAIDNNFTTLTQAVITGELLPILTDPFKRFTVFAPTNDGFNILATNLNTDVNGILSLPNLTDVLTYHVIENEVLSGDLTNGLIATPVNDDNTIKFTIKSNGEVFANHAQVALADVMADNGVVHVIDQVILPSETIVDIAIDNNFSTLTQALITAELLPTIIDPFASLTVFAPTNDAFNALAAALNTDLNGLLELPILGDVLTYHVLGDQVLSTDLTNGTVATLNGNNITINIDNGVTINDANVTTADVVSSNGVVHIIDKVLLPGTLGISKKEIGSFRVYPNPANQTLQLDLASLQVEKMEILNVDGRIVYTTKSPLTTIDISKLDAGQYIIKLQVGGKTITQTFSKI